MTLLARVTCQLWLGPGRVLTTSGAASEVPFVAIVQSICCKC